MLIKGGGDKNRVRKLLDIRCDRMWFGPLVGVLNRKYQHLAIGAMGKGGERGNENSAGH